MSGFRALVRRFVSDELRLSDEEISALEERSNTLIARPLSFWLLMAMIAATTVVGVIFLGSWLAVWLIGLGLPPLAVNIGARLGVAFGVILLWMRLITRMYARPLRRSLRDMGYDICLRCGYWLKGLDETIDACPECGTKREGPTEPAKSSAFDTGLKGPEEHGRTPDDGFDHGPG